MVVDCSCVAAWLLGERLTPEMTAFQRRLTVDGADAPALFLFEIENALLVAVRRGRIGAPHAAQLLKLLDAQDIRLDHVSAGSPQAEAGFQLALRHSLTSYDAAYLELAVRLGAELATLDTRLSAAARVDGVPLVDLGPTP